MAKIGTSCVGCTFAKKIPDENNQLTQIGCRMNFIEQMEFLGGEVVKMGPDLVIKNRVCQHRNYENLTPQESYNKNYPGITFLILDQGNFDNTVRLFYNITNLGLPKEQIIIVTKQEYHLRPQYQKLIRDQDYVTVLLDDSPIQKVTKKLIKHQYITLVTKEINRDAVDSLHSQLNRFYKKILYLKYNNTEIIDTNVFYNIPYENIKQIIEKGGPLYYYEYSDNI